MRLNIEIGTEILPEGWRWDPKNPVTGTTKFYVRMAEELVKLGNRVFVKYDGPEMGHNSVAYIPRDRNVPSDLIIDCNLQRPAPQGRTKRFQWTSFFGRRDTCVGAGYDRLFLVSDYVHSTLSDVVKAPVTVLELGCDMPTVAEPHLMERPKVCCYTSSHDRGGQQLAGWWPEIEKATGYKLEMSHYDAGFSDEKLMSLYDRSRFWLYPAFGLDSIVSTLEAQARGCMLFYVPHMGLPQTARYGIATDHFKFQEHLIEVLNRADSNFPLYELTRSAQLAARPLPTWNDVAQRILQCIIR